MALSPLALPEDPQLLDTFNSVEAFKDWFMDYALKQKNWIGRRAYSKEYAEKMFDQLMNQLMTDSEKCTDDFLRKLYFYANKDGTIKTNNGCQLYISGNSLGVGGLTYPAYAYPLWLWKVYLNNYSFRHNQLQDALLSVSNRLELTDQVLCCHPVVRDTPPAEDSKPLFNRRLEVYTQNQAAVKIQHS